MRRVRRSRQGYSRGAYILVASLFQDQPVAVGSLGIINFRSGSYAYIGSALGGLEARLCRHLRQQKKLHWHIDYLLHVARVDSLIWADTGRRIECRLAGEFLDHFTHVPGFGCSDCRCRSHLFWNSRPDRMIDMARQAFLACRLEPVVALMGWKKSLT